MRYPVLAIAPALVGFLTLMTPARSEAIIDPTACSGMNEVAFATVPEPSSVPLCWLAGLEPGWSRRV